MILYDNNFKPVGISQDILNFLGYEDIDDFQTYATDIADLFIKKSGFIHKFDDFSWIKYVLHSGAPNKSALVRLKSGKEREIQLSIKELFLLGENKNSPYYEITIANSTLEKSSIEQDEPIFNISERPKTDTKKEQKNQISVVHREKLKTKKKNSKKPYIATTQKITPKQSTDETMFIEDLSEENLSFLKTYELPKIIKRENQATTKPMHKKVSNEEQIEQDAFIKEFLDYNDLIVLELLHAVNKKDLQSVRTYAINLAGIAQMLQLGTIKARLELLKNSKDDTVRKHFEEYEEALENLRRKIKC